MDQPLSRQTLVRRTRLRLLTGLALALACGAAAWSINHALGPSVSLSEVMVAEVRRGSIANTINASGLVIPVHEEVVSSPIQTRVAKVIARPGQAVAAGELLLELDDREIRLAIDALTEQLAQEENRIVGLGAEMEQKRRQAVGAIELLELDLKSAQVRRDRNEILRKSGLVTGDDMLTSELNVQRVGIQLRQQRQLIDDTRRTTGSAIEGARLQKNILQKQMAQQQRQLDQAKVRAPFAGMLTSLMSEEGASVAAGQMVARVSELNNYRVEASISDFHARSLVPGQKVQVEHGGQQLAGRVQTILPEIQNGTVKLLVALDKPDHALLRNKLRVEVNIVTEQRDGTLVIDGGPAFNGRGAQAAWVVKDGMARKTTVTLGAGDGKAVEILAGARVGDRLIISDLTRVKEFDALRVSP
ncbi:MAG: HlyD family efflux transporter periplasmic adaptor subunit [Massilia sp.]